MKYFPVYTKGILLKTKVGDVHAVDGVSLTIYPSETLGLVGESGCGKTTTAKVALSLEPPDSGEVILEGKNVYDTLNSGKSAEKKYVRRNMQMIFQNPYGSLDPRMTVYDIISEPFIIHGHLPKNQWMERVYALLKMVGLEEYHAERYPHEFSGGQRGRNFVPLHFARLEFGEAGDPESRSDVPGKDLRIRANRPLVRGTA